MKTYKVVYECFNCGTDFEMDVEYGKPIPLLVSQKTLDKVPESLRRGAIVAPPCSYCGTETYRHGRKP